MNFVIVFTATFAYWTLLSIFAFYHRVALLRILLDAMMDAMRETGTTSMKITREEPK